MCAGTIYWTGIGRVLYAASESRLKELTGSNNNENMTMSLPCRTILQAGQRPVEVIGPVTGWEQKIVDVMKTTKTMSDGYDYDNGTLRRDTLRNND